MIKGIVLLVLFAATGVGQDCVKYGAQTTVAGTLLLKDEAGYNQYIAIRFVRAICVEADPKEADDPNDPYYRVQRGIKEVQAGVYGGDPASAALRERLHKLIGHRVVITGDLFPATTGYDRTNVDLRVSAVDPADSSGRQALLAPTPEIKIKDVDAYDLTINAGKRLVIEARETVSAAPLLPSDAYVTHWMTGAQVLYVDCRDGYQRKLIRSTGTDGGICASDDDFCGLSAFPKKPLVLKLRCTKKQ